MQKKNIGKVNQLNDNLMNLTGLCTKTVLKRYRFPVF